MKRVSDKLSVFLTCMGLTLATIVAFEQVPCNKFINFDDDDYVTENPYVKAGLTSQSIVWAFTSSHSFNWHPLTWLSHMLDCELFDLNPFWHHFTSLLFHIANTLLLFWVLKRMTGAIWPSGFVAAAFALHPLHVESVAWVAERKDVLSGFFWMLTIGAYVFYAERPGIKRYLLVVLAFSLGLMAKPMVVTLPFVLLLLDYWPLGRFRWRIQSRDDALRECESVESNYQSSTVYGLVGEKVPLFILVIVSSVVTFIVQQSEGAMATIENMPLSFRLVNALVSYTEYIGKMIYPGRLAVFYPLPSNGFPIWRLVVSFIILVGISAGVVYTVRRYRYLAVGWLWYLGTLVPVIGLVQVGGQAMADRYTYLPSIGIFIMAAWGGAELLGKRRYRRIVLGTMSGIVLASLLACTWIQVSYWRNDFTLFRRALAVTENNYVIHNNYGMALLEKGRDDEAFTHFTEALRINPRSSIANINVGVAYLKQGNFGEAIAHLNEALRVRTDWPEVYNYLGMAYAREGKYDLAIENYNQALRLKPDYLDAINNLGMALEKQGKVDQAIGEWQKVLQLAPNHADAHFNIGLAMAWQKKYDLAIEHFTEALQARPDWAQAYYYLGLAYARQDKFEQAIQNYKQALGIEPNFVDAHIDLGSALTRVGNLDEAIKHYTEALRLKDDRIDVINNLAWILATAEDQKVRNPAEAVKLAERGCELTKYEQPDLLDTLAVAYAAAGRFSEAIETSEKAISLAKETGRDELVDEIQNRLKLYKAGQPYIKGPSKQDNGNP